MERIVPPDGNTLVLGEMGIGNTAAAALLMHGLTGVPLIECIGRGTGLDDAGLERKHGILRAAWERRAPPQDPIELLTEFGGCEIAMLVGAMLGAAERRHLVIIDGFTVTVAAALAARIAPAVLDYCVFGHCSQEQAHRQLLAYLGVQTAARSRHAARRRERCGARPVGGARGRRAFHGDGDVRGCGSERKNKMSHQLRLLCVATQFLTRLPTPRLREFDPSWLSQSTRYFPLVGVLVGLANVLVWWIASRRLPASVSIGLMMAVSMLLTGAFHEDGFADACDGFGGGSSKERVLAIMKDSRIGAFGAIGLFLMLGLKWTTLVALPGAVFAQCVVASHMLSRWCAIGLIAFLPYVRADADAKARDFAGRLSGGEWILSGVIGLLGACSARVALPAQRCSVRLDRSRRRRLCRRGGRARGRPLCAASDRRVHRRLSRRGPAAGGARVLARRSRRGRLGARLGLSGSMEIYLVRHPRP